MSILTALSLRLQQQVVQTQWSCIWRPCKRLISNFRQQRTLQPRQSIIVFKRSLRKIQDFESEFEQMGKLARLNAFKSQNKRDKVPEHFQLIYNHQITITYNIIGLKLISIATIVVVLCSGVKTLYEESGQNYWSESTLPLLVMACILLISCSVVLVLTRRMFSRIYYNPSNQEFIAVRTSLFGRMEHLNYTEGDIHLKPQGKKVTDLDFGKTVIIKGRQVALNPENFLLPVYHNIHFKRTKLNPDRDAESEIE